MCRPVKITAGAFMVSAIGPRAVIGLAATAAVGVALVAVVRTGLNATVLAGLSVVVLAALVVVPVLLARRANRPVALGYQHAPVKRSAPVVLLEARVVPAIADAVAAPDAITTNSARLSA